MRPFRNQKTLVAALLALTAAQAARADSPTFHHHHRSADGEEQDHYKDEGEKPARLQVGRTVFQARALVDKRGVTDVEITTGTLDSGVAPPGRLNEVHVKAFQLSGKPQFEYEFKSALNEGGAAHASFPLAAATRSSRDDDDDHGESKRNTNLERGQILRLRVEARGLRTGDEGEAEARLEQAVKYRPDLAVASLNFPAVARSNTAVDVSASILEVMRDTGAHADCVLQVDGVQVDQASGIWVDANGAVTCHFVQVFKVQGEHRLTVSLVNVVPGDYDPDSNSLSATIRIENPALMAYFSSAVDLRSDVEFVQDIYATSASLVPDQHVSSSTVRRIQSRALNGTIPGAVNFPLHKVGYSDESDGTALSTLAFSDLPADSTGPLVDPIYDTLSMILRYDSATGGWFTLNRYLNSVSGTGVTNVNFSFYGGDAVYHSESYCRSVAGILSCLGGDYTRNPPPVVTSFGAPRVTLGKMYGVDVVVDDGSAYQAHPMMALSTASRKNANPASCVPSTLNGSTGKVCTQFTTTSSVTQGSAVYQP